jgi:integrase
MARTIDKLSPFLLRRAATGMHPDGGGLYLHVNKDGARSWIFRYMRHGRAHEMGLGPLHTIPLKDARQRATECRRQLLDGIDPIDARNAQRQQQQLTAAREVSFEDDAKAYIDAHKAGWKNKKHADQWISTLTAYVYPAFGKLPARLIDTPLVVKALQPIWTTKPETAARVRGRIESILDWAKAIGHRDGENPARWRGHLENLLPRREKVRKVKHHPAMPFDDVPGLMVALTERPAMAARALAFTILTAARTEEVLGARRPEIDRAKKLWTVPEGRMKGSKEHRVPLSDAAIDALAKAGCFDGDADGYLFPGMKRSRPLSNMAMLNLLQERMGYPELTVHGFRSSFSDWTSERTHFTPEVREMALSHAIDNKVEAAYRRGELLEKRRELMAAWATFCTTPAPTGDNVVALHG